MASESKDENPEHINLKVMGQDGNVVQFKIKRHTALKKLMSTYCERAGLALQTIRFSFDGTRINESDTPKGLDMEDGDTIEVFQQQSGGIRRSREQFLEGILPFDSTPDVSPTIEANVVNSI